MENPIISIRNLNLYFEKQHVLKNINIEIPHNKVTVILGPSGCGKTTLLKTLNRLVDLHDHVKISGKIMLDDKDILVPNIDVTGIRKKWVCCRKNLLPCP